MILSYIGCGKFTSLLIIYVKYISKLLTLSLQIIKNYSYLTGFSSRDPKTNNSTRNFKMKKLLIATTALVATAGMAAADITITGHAAAGYHSGLAGTAAALDTAIAGSAAAVTDAEVAAAATALAAAREAAEGIYSNAGVDFAMSGATDNGIAISATVNIDAGTEVDTGDFEFDGADGGTAGLGAVVMSGTFGTLTFDNNGIDNMYSDATTHDVSYATTLGAVGLTIGYDATDASTNATSMQATYTAGGMAFTLTGSEDAAGTSSELAVSYALNDTVTITADTDQAAGAEAVQTIGASTTLNGVSVAISSANDSTWDVSLGYTAGGFALSYATDEADAWEATASTSLGGGASFAAGVNASDAMYAGVSFAF
jgi:outer membrane protein OmpU